MGKYESMLLVSLLTGGKKKVKQGATAKRQKAIDLGKRPTKYALKISASGLSK